MSDSLVQQKRVLVLKPLRRISNLSSITDYVTLNKLYQLSDLVCP